MGAGLGLVIRTKSIHRLRRGSARPGLRVNQHEGTERWIIRKRCGFLYYFLPFAANGEYGIREFERIPPVGTGEDVVMRTRKERIS